MERMLHIYFRYKISVW